MAISSLLSLMFSRVPPLVPRLSENRYRLPGHALNSSPRSIATSSGKRFLLPEIKAELCIIVQKGTIWQVIMTNSVEKCPSVVEKTFGW
ncbi:MAG: hypothetical protein IH599_01900 [Bacteroidales bacterium]|nr:hypothetical protein [Bacteroidales bacterium]